VHPTTKVIIENMVYLMHSNRAGRLQRSNEETAFILPILIQEH